MRYIGILFCLTLSNLVQAGVVSTFGSRWDAAPRVVAGNERSLDGGLRFSVSGGSFLQFRDQFQWNVTPSVSAFQQAVEQSFSAWTMVDSVSGLGTSLSFVPDFATSVASGASFGTLDINGAEIDLVASNQGTGALTGLTVVSANGFPVTLTSGVSSYANSATIQGVDLHLNNNPNAVYSLDVFRRLLTHEIGHAIGLGDVDLGGDFIDDNFDPNDPVGTLTNSWAELVDPFDPANSAGLSTFSVAPTTFSENGVDILMESNGVGIGPTNPLSNLFPLTNDDFGTRQYLYPSVTAVPEPGTGGILIAGLAAGMGWRRRRSRAVK